MSEEVLSYEDYYNEYINMKSIQYLWCSNDNYYIDDKLFDEVYKLEWFKDMILENRDLIDDVMCKNIKNVVEKYRYIDDEDRIKRLHIINEIIVSLNSSYDKDKNYEFYRQEIAKRYDNKKYLKLSNYNVDRNKEMIISSIACDYILLSLICEYNDQDFKNVISKIDFNNFHILSLNAILYEFPLIITDPNFIPRVNILLKQKYLKKDNKKLVKKINKIIDEFNKGV